MVAHPEGVDEYEPAAVIGGTRQFAGTTGEFRQHENEAEGGAGDSSSAALRPEYSTRPRTVGAVVGPWDPVPSGDAWPGGRALGCCQGWMVWPGRGCRTRMVPLMIFRR
jgi:hypothetical protein